MMTCNYFDFKKLTEKLFYGVALTDNHLNDATEVLRQYLVSGGAGNVVKALGIGIKVEEKQFPFFPELNEIVRHRFVWVDGERKGQELHVSEIESIGMFLKHGAFHGRCGIPAL